MKVVASLTTIPDREFLCYNCVKSLVKIEPPLEAIIVTIPLKFMRTKKKYPKESISKLKALDPRVQIRRTENDMGPGVKYLGFSPDPDTATFVCDDDHIYPGELVNRLRNKMVKVHRNRGFYPIVQNHRRKKGIFGVRGLMCPPGSIAGYSKFMTCLPKSALEIDDDTFQLFATLKQVPIFYTKKYTPVSKIFKGKPPHALSYDEGKRRRIQRELREFVHRKGKALLQIVRHLGK